MASLSPDRVDELLDNWQRWMESATLPGQLKAASAKRSYATRDWDSDAEYEEMHRQAAVTTNAAIEELCNSLKTAVMVEHGIKSKLHRLPDHAGAYDLARSRLAITLYRKGLV